MAVHSRSLLVRSCAGSGKSSVLAARCASLIASGADPERTILLTFSVRSKLDLESKICEVLPTGRPRVLTHHANALAILRKAGCTSRVIASKSQRKIMRAILASRSHDPPTQDAVRQGLSLVARVKGSGSLPAHDSSERHIVEEYQRMLRERGEIDFEDMVLSAAHVLRQAASASTASAFPAKPFDHLLLDEAQDMSASQIQLPARIGRRDRRRGQRPADLLLAWLARRRALGDRDLLGLRRPQSAHKLPLWSGDRARGQGPHRGVKPSRVPDAAPHRSQATRHWQRACACVRIAR
jgi:superfamily I DNA/RNA helicase